MATPRKDNKIEAASIASTTGAVDSNTKAILDAMRKQSETFTKRLEMLTRNLEETQRITNEENRKRATEIELLGKNISKLQLKKDVATTDLESLITIDESIITAGTTKERDRQRIPVPSREEIPVPLDDEQSFVTAARRPIPTLRAKDALKCIPVLNGEDDIGVEDFIREVREMRMMCNEPHLLLKMIKIEKIVGKAAMAIRNISIGEYGMLYEALRQNVSTQASMREYQDQLREIRQGLNENVQSYIIRFRRAFNKLQYSVTNEYSDEITRRAMNDRILKDTVTDFIRGLRTEIGQVLLANPPYNIVEAEKRASDVERYFREDRTRKQTMRPQINQRRYDIPQSHPRNDTSQRTNKVPTAIAARPVTSDFQRAERAPLQERAQLRCFKCNRLGHTSNQCVNFRILSQQSRPPPINKINTKDQKDEYESMQPQESYQTSYLDLPDNSNEDSLSTQEQESTLLNKNGFQKIEHTLYH